MDERTKIAVFGGGSWATAIVKMLSENRDEIGWYMRSTYARDHLLKQRHNPNYLSSVEFDTTKLIISNDINELVDYADILIIAIPSAFLNSELEKLILPLKDKTIFSAIKGIIPETSQIAGEYFHDSFGVPYNQIGVITGPCHAEEVALERLSYLTVACTDDQRASFLANALKSDYIKTTTSDDIIGTEYAAVLKNIYAVAAGMAHGLGYGDNFQAVLMSNAIREMKRFIKRIHKMKRNINNSAYLGDLLVTGYSVFSRNRMFGNMIGKGYTVKSAMMEMNMVAEGYYATKGAYTISSREKRRSRLPIMLAVYAVLYEGKDPKPVFKALTEKLD